jgi:hypothetical protein
MNQEDSNPAMLGVRDGDWVHEVRAVIDGSGHIVVAWTKATMPPTSTPQLGVLSSSEWSPGSGWQAPTQVDTIAAQPALSNNSQGDVLMSWVRIHTDYTELAIQQRSAAGVWSAARGMGAGGAAKPRNATGEHGESAIFYQKGESLMIVPFETSSGWRANRQVAPLEPGEGQILDDSWQIGSVGDRAFELVWGEVAKSGRASLSETRRNSSSDWTTPTEVVTAGGFVAPTRWGANAVGGLILGWTVASVSGCSRYVAGNWLPMGACAGNSKSLAAVAIAANGAAFAASYPDEHDSTLMVRRSADGSTWTGAEPVGIPHGTATGQVQLATDSEGNAVVAWEHVSGETSSVWMNRYNTSVGWTQPVQLSLPDANAKLGALAMNAYGRGVVIWADAQTVQAKTFE